MKSDKLAAKVAIVTGAGGGLGRAHAIELAQHGAKVVVNDLSTAAEHANAVVSEIEALGGQASAGFADVSDWEASGRLIQNTLDRWGDLNILVNNAGNSRRNLIRDLSREDWEAVVSVHGTGHMSTTHFACRYWAEKSERLGETVDGTMIHTVSRSATMGRERSVNYSFSKGGIMAMSLVAAHEMGQFGVTSNCISPTARTNPLSETVFGRRQDGAAYDKFDAENISPFVAFLATEEGRNISGEIFEVRGDDEGVGIWRMRQTAPAEMIHASGRWEVDGLITNYLGLFENGPPTIPTAPKENWKN